MNEQNLPEPVEIGSEEHQKIIDDIEQTDEQTETYENEMTIKRTSPCGNYRVPIKGIKEVVRRTPGVSEEDVKEALESGEPIKGWTFTEV
jgi:hypothetical protein